MQPYRQGDILFVPVSRPRGSRVVRRKRDQDIIVAEGEATGHHHRIKDMNTRLIALGSRTFVRTGSDGAVISHEEHDDLALPGDSTFEVIHQREHEPAKRTAPSRTRNVWD